MVWYCKVQIILFSWENKINKNNNKIFIVETQLQVYFFIIIIKDGCGSTEDSGFVAFLSLIIQS